MSINVKSAKHAIALATGSGYQNSNALGDCLQALKNAESKKHKGRPTAQEIDEEMQELINKRNEEAKAFEIRQQKRREKETLIEKQQRQSEEKELKANENGRKRLKDSQVVAMNTRSRKKSDATICHHVHVGKILAAVYSLPDIQRIWALWAYAARAEGWVSKSDIEDLFLNLWKDYCFSLVKAGRTISDKKFTGVYRLMPYIVQNFKALQLRQKEDYTKAKLVELGRLSTDKFTRDYGEEIGAVYAILDNINKGALTHVYQNLPAVQENSKKAA